MKLLDPWTELFLTLEASRHSQVLAALEQAGLPCREKIQNAGHVTRRTGNVGASAGSSVLYQVFVRKSQLEEAREILDRDPAPAAPRLTAHRKPPLPGAFFLFCRRKGAGPCMGRGNQLQ